jgi:hypothetical protein
VTIVRDPKIVSSITTLLPIQTMAKHSPWKTMAGSADRAHVIDDGLAIRQLTTTTAARQEIECDCASTGIEARQLLDSTRDDAVIINLPISECHGRY